MENNNQPFNNFDVFPGIIVNIYGCGYATNDLFLCEETQLHECSINYPYLEQRYKEIYGDQTI